MHRGTRRLRPPRAGLLGLLCLAALAAGGPAARAATPGPNTITIDAAHPGRRIPAGFVGLSMEYNTVTAYEGTTAATANPVLAQLIRGLAPGQTPILRIGGDSTDWTWWPISGLSVPAGLSNQLTPVWLQRAQQLVQATRAKFILGVNLEADNPRIASTEAHQLITGIGPQNLQALEIGNEPMLYPVLPWYHLASGTKVFGRPLSYSLAQYEREFTAFSHVLPDVPLAGPAIGHSWLAQLPPFVRTAPRLGMVTFHSYAINAAGQAFRGRNCSTALADPSHATVSTLLAPFASEGLMRGAGPVIAAAHARRLPFRVDEMNAITCAGTPGVSDTFASALWALDALFADVSAGVDGVNIHTWRGSAGKLFGFSQPNGQWTASVRPEYYGLLAFTQGAPAGARLLTTAQSQRSTVASWATLGSDHKLRVVLINHGLGSTQTVAVRVPSPRGPARLTRLQAPSAAANSGVTLGGQTFGDATTTGALSGPVVATPVPRAAGAYSVRIPAASAAILTVGTGVSAG